MPDIFVYLLLSLGSGATYALLGNGIVAMYKGSGILNFAQGGVAMFAAYCYMQLMTDGSSKLAALLIVMAGAAAFGVIFAVAVVRPLRNAPILGKVVVTLGLLVALQGLASLIWGESSNPVESLFPTDSISVGGDTNVGADRIYMFGTAVVIAAALWALYRFTRLGLATQAASENEIGASLLGFSPTVIASINWALGSALAALAGVLIAAITTLDSATMPMLVLPALAAALVGRFASFGITTAAAFGIGWIQTTLLNTWEQPGVQTAAPFVVVIVVMVLAGRALPTRGALSEGRPPKAPAGDSRWPLMVVSIVVAVVALVMFNGTYQAAFATSLTTAILALSLVVLTGYVGQISLMQLTFAGIGGFITVKLAADLGFPFPLSILAGAAIIAPISALLGLPALRIRGLSLAVVTLGAAVAVDAVLFQNQDWTGGLDGMAVPSASLFGASVDPFEHPVRYGLVVLFALVVVAILVGNIRRSGIGRRMLAVRSNERAAAVAGVNVSAVKLQAFTIAGVIAAISGGLLAYSNPFIVFGSGQFSALPSITLLTLVYLGGIASVAGGVMAGVIASGGVMYVVLSGVGGFDDYFAMISGVLLILTVLLQPDGAMVAVGEQIRGLGRKLRGGEGPPSGSSPTAGGPVTRPTAVEPDGERVPVP
jgi:branched-chain amino acid transport system permease protein